MDIKILESALSRSFMAGDSSRTVTTTLHHTTKMGSNVLPLFWHLASSSAQTRLTATADLVEAVQSFQAQFEPKSAADDDEDEDDDDEKDDGSDISMDDDEIDPQAARLDAELARNNAEDVVYCVKRLIRGLGSSRDSSRLGFAVALTELLARTPSVTAVQVLSLLQRSSTWSKTMKGSEERDMMFARLFGTVAVSDSGALYAPSASEEDFERVLDSLLQLGRGKAWLAEAAGWALLRVVRGLLASKVEWKEAAVQSLLNKVYEEDSTWTPEKVALSVELAAVKADWKALLAPTFKHAPLLCSQNLPALGRILKDGRADDDEAASGAYNPKLHFVWDVILSAYTRDGKLVTPKGWAPFTDLYRVVVDESLFSNSSSAERKYHGFQVFERALPLLDGEQLPLAFTPNFMRTWMNHLSSADRHLYKAAMRAAKVVQEHVKANPAAGCTLLSQLVGKHGRPDFDKVTKTKTVETILSSLDAAGVADFVSYLENVLRGDNDADATSREEKRVWALDQMLALCRNGAIPKDDAWVQRVLDDLQVYGFFIVRSADKKSSIAPLKQLGKPFSDASSAIARARFFAALVEATKAADSGKWVQHALGLMTQLEKNKHVELASDADEEIKALRTKAGKVLESAKKADGGAAKGLQILLPFLVLQTYDDVEDALDMLDDATGAAEGILGKKADDEVPPIDALLDVLIALLDKGSADLRTLGNLVFGLVAPSMGRSAIDHLVVQLEQAGAEVDAEEEDEDDEEMDEDDDEEEDDDSEEEEESEDEADDGGVDPDFRARVAEALQVSGLAADEDADSDDESVWDDDQMLAVDAQLAAVFKQNSSNPKRSDLKHAAIESAHFKTRILDFADAYLKRPSAPALGLVLPLLRLVRSPGELANKAAGIIRQRLGKGQLTLAESDMEEAAEVLAEVHALARRAPSAEFSALCAAASAFLSRAAPAAAAKAYAETASDFVSRKHSQVHPAFVADYVKRFPARAIALTSTLLAPAVNAYRQTQAYGLVGQLMAQLPALVKSSEVSRPEAQKLAQEALDAALGTLAKAGEDDGYKADRCKDVAKFALAAARALKTLDAPRSAAGAEQTLEKLKDGRTKEMKSVQGLITQLIAVLNAGEKKEKKPKAAAKGKKAEEDEEEEKKKVKGEKRKAKSVKASPKTKKAKKAKA